MQPLSAEPEAETETEAETEGRRQTDPGSCEKATQIKALHNEAAAARSATKSA